MVDGELHFDVIATPDRMVARINNDGSFTFVATIKDVKRIQKQTITAEDAYHKIK